jgi:hypothetical protein
MTDENRTLPGLEPSRGLSLVLRSHVPADLPYTEYRPYLRRDFFYSCAYCTITEAEASALRFTIDHYEPKSARQDLENDYKNLMYACDQCNQYKGNRNPPPEARAEGHRFFRPDEDHYEDHFEEVGLRLNGSSATGHFTIDAVNLNRQSLRKLRDLRRRLYEVDEYVAEGVRGLRKVPLDRLPPQVKGRALKAQQQAASLATKLADAIDYVLARDAQSPLMEDNAGNEDSEERLARLRALERGYRGSWRAARKPVKR